MTTEAFRTELEALISKHSMERGSNTPDSILAKYLAKCLTNFDETAVARDAWHERYGRQSSDRSAAWVAVHWSVCMRNRSSCDFGRPGGPVFHPLLSLVAAMTYPDARALAATLLNLPEETLDLSRRR